MHPFNKFDSFFSGESVHGEITRLIIQYFRESGYFDVANLIEEKLDTTIQSKDFLSFQQAFLLANWNEVEGICRSTIARNKGSPANLNYILEVIYQAAFYERLSGLEYQECVRILRKLSSIIEPSNDHVVQKMAFELVLRSTNENLETILGRSFDKICELIPSFEYVPKGRLLTLLEQALHWQTEKSHCNSPEIISLLTDYSKHLLLLPNKVAFTCVGHTDEVWDVCYSPNGVYLASACRNGAVFIWDATRYTIRHRFSGHTKAVTRLQWSPDSKLLLSCSQDTTVRIWCIEKFSCLQTIIKHSADVTAISWTTDSKFFFSAGHDGNIFKFTRNGVYQDGKYVKTRITDMVMDSSGVIYFVSVSHTIYTLHWAMEPNQQMTQKLLHSDDGIMAIELSKLVPNELLVTLSNRKILLINSQTGEQIRAFNGVQMGKYTKRAYICGPQDNFIIIGTDQDVIYLWNKHSGTQIATLTTDQRCINALSWRVAGTYELASCGDDGRIVIWSHVSNETHK